MDKERILAILRDHAAELKAAGMVHVRLFGSVARGEANPQSDVDVMVDFDKTKPITLITVAGLERRLAEMLGARVDLCSEEWMRKPVSKRALQEAIVAF